MGRVKQLKGASTKRKEATIAAAMRRIRRRLGSNDDRMAVASHEAGHAFVALSLGATDVSVSLGARRTRHVHLSRYRQELIRVSGLVAVAGSMAEMHAFHEKLIPEQKYYLPGHATDRAKAQSLAAEVKGAQVSDTVAVWRAIVFRFIANNIPTFTRIAHLIYSRPYVDKRQIFLAAGKYRRIGTINEPEFSSLAELMKQDPIWS